MAQITPDPIMRIAMGFMAAKHLFVANEIGLFTGLARGPATIQELAAICGIPPRTAGISADAMVSLGLLERDGDRYRNCDTAAAFLAGQPGPNLWPMPRFWNRISYPGWLAVEDAVRAAPGRRSSASLAPRSSRFSRPESKPFLQRRQRHWRPITSFRGIAGCSTLEAAPARSCSPSCDGTLRCAALCSSCRVLARWRVVGSQASPRGSGSTWSRANTVHVLSAAHNLDLLRKLRARRRRARTCCLSICGWIRAIRILSCQASS